MDFDLTVPQAAVLVEVSQEISGIPNDQLATAPANCITDCAVQTEDMDNCQSNTYCTTETQTPTSEDWLSPLNEEIDFSNCNLYDAMYDIETQTNWSIDGTTQTDWSDTRFLPQLFDFD